MRNQCNGTVLADPVLADPLHYDRHRNNELMFIMSFADDLDEK